MAPQPILDEDQVEKIAEGAVIQQMAGLLAENIDEFNILTQKSPKELFDTIRARMKAQRRMGTGR